MGFGHVPTPAKHVLLVHMNMLQGLKMHQGFEIRHVLKYKYLPVNNESRYSFVGWATGCPYKGPWFEASGREQDVLFF